jgi:hypothetical protein
MQENVQMNQKPRQINVNVRSITKHSNVCHCLQTRSISHDTIILNKRNLTKTQQYSFSFSLIEHVSIDLFVSVQEEKYLHIYINDICQKKPSTKPVIDITLMVKHTHTHTPDSMQVSRLAFY